MQQHGAIPALHQLLARLNNIDNYSYEYEMMLAEGVIFSDAQGLAQKFLTSADFDQLGFGTGMRRRL
ncbi:MAG: hypothetical protein COB23_06750 [Methylophaga sp.]|nr:MAG: hypothetical protein COB23_06750 [Methylophaga sp.]